MIQKLLLCLNESYRNSQEKIQKFFERKFLGKSKINRIYDFVYDLDSFKEKLPLVRNNDYDALIVLCELIWEEQGKSHSYTDFWGINLYYLSHSVPELKSLVDTLISKLFLSML